MFGSALFLALFDTALSISGDLPQTCKNAITCVEPKKLISQTECGAACDANRCCTEKKIKVVYWDWSVSDIDGVESGATHVDAVDTDGKSLLIYYAGDEEDINIASRLIASGASVNLQDDRGETALMPASMAGNSALVEKLVVANASLDITDNDGKNALMHATSSVRLPVIEQLLGYCAEVGKKELDNMDNVEQDGHVDEATWNILKQRLSQARWPYITAIEADDLQSISAFSGDACNRSHVNETKNGRSLLMFAVNLEKKDIVDELIRRKADVNARDRNNHTALMLATTKNNAIVKCLLASSQVEVNAVDNDGRSALMIAAANCRMDNVQSFLDVRVIEVNAKDRSRQTALMHALRCPVDMIKLLIEGGANVGARGDEDRTALMQAVDDCNAPVISVLLEYGNANLCNMKYLDNETVLMHAVKNCDVDVVDLLVKQSNIKINAKRLAATALMIAVKKNRSLDIIASLLRHPDVSVEPTRKKTDSALVRAVAKNRLDIVKYLLLANADPEVEYNKTLTVLGYAVQKNVNVEIVKLLLKYNATVDHRFMRGLSMTHCSSEIVRVIQDARWPLLKKIENRMSGLSIKIEMTSMRHRKSKMELDECMGFFEPKTMWMMAANANNTDAMEQLLRLDTKHQYIDQSCNTSYTPLCIAATENHVEIATLLLNECPNLDLRCDKNNYALGISFDDRKKYDKSALEIAKEKGFSDIAQEIRYKKWILLGKIARNETKSVRTLRREYMDGSHKCNGTIAMRSYVINPEEKCDRNETVVDWAIQYGQENILAEISAVFPEETIFGLCSRNVTRYSQKIARILQCPTIDFEKFGFLAFLIIPLCCLLYPIVKR